MQPPPPPPPPRTQTHIYVPHLGLARRAVEPARRHLRSKESPWALWRPSNIRAAALCGHEPTERARSIRSQARTVEALSRVTQCVTWPLSGDLCGPSQHLFSVQIGFTAKYIEVTVPEDVSSMLTVLNTAAEAERNTQKNKGNQGFVCCYSKFHAFAIIAKLLPDDWENMKL